ncbi:MAG: DUF1549 domain-containing protein, partial [Planctomycetes bacterium]|nr:DUF1549 domain-containing protein [Planctomycetota bacterium]
MKTPQHGFRVALARVFVIAVLLGTFALEASAAKLEPIAVGKPQRIEVYPSAISLSGPRQHGQLVVTGHYAGGQVQDLTRAAKFVPADASVAEVNGSVVRPKQAGKTEIIVTVGGQTAKTTVEVTNHGTAEPVSFGYGLLAALSKQGCNSGACHGSPSGKGGFRLSLRAFDSELDKLTLIREAYGRRTNVLEPEKSLMLLKPTMKVSHGGGQQLRKSDVAYAVIRDWISEGCRLDPPDSPKCVKIEVYPSTGRVLKRPAHTQQLSVLAHFSDGSVRDVTDLAVYTSSDEAVATVEASGMVVGHDRGETAVIIRYLEFIETSYLTFVKDIEGFAWNDPPTANYIDRHVYKKLKQLKFVPAELCTDDEFIRRIYLDVIGLLPSIAEAEKFLGDKSPDKRAKLIDALLERPEFAKFWALKWGDVLRISAKQIGKDAVYKYNLWLERAFANNMPYDEFASALLLASGSSNVNPPANYYRTASDTNDAIETTAQLFLGARLQCAKCHNHPFERWTQQDYRRFVSIFDQVRFDMSPELRARFSDRLEKRRRRAADGHEVGPPLPRLREVYVADLPRHDRSAPTAATRVPKALGGPVLGPTVQADVSRSSGTRDDRVALMDWFNDPQNPLFARNIVNRVWAHHFGRGLVEPLDGFSAANLPSHTCLLDDLAADFVDHGYNIRRLERLILNSATWQLSSEPNDSNRADRRYFARAYVRMPPAETILDMWRAATGVAVDFGDGVPDGIRAVEIGPSRLGDARWDRFLDLFGRSARTLTCDCAPPISPSIRQTLALMSDAYDSAIEKDPLDRMAVALCQAITEVESLRTAAGVEEQSFLNIAVTDGRCAVVSRYVSQGPEEAHSLYYASGCLVVERGEGRVVEREGESAVVVASEPLGPDTHWTPVPPNHMVRVDDDRTVE